MALDHPLAGLTQELPLEALVDQTFLTLSPGHRLSHIVAGLSARAGGRVSDEYEGTSLDAIRLMAATGAGLAILPSIYAAVEARRGTDVCLRVLSDPTAKRDIALIQPALPEPRTGSDILAEVLRREALDLLGP